MRPDATNHVLVVIQARSGSSLLTRILHEHGLWMGEHRGMVGPGWGYETYESACVHKYMEVDNITPKGLRRVFLSEIPRDTRAVLKISIQMYKQWIMALPEACFVFMVRDAAAVAESLWRKGRTDLDCDAMLPHAKLWNDRIYWSSVITRRPLVLMSRVMEGDYSSLAVAMDACGMKMDRRIVDSCIDRNLWCCQPDKHEIETLEKHCGKF